MIGAPVNATVWVAPEKKLTGIRPYYVLSFYFSSIPLFRPVPVRRFDGTALTLASWRAISPAEDFKCYSEPLVVTVATTVGVVCREALGCRRPTFIALPAQSRFRQREDYS